MAVEIDLELEAGDVQGEILAVAGALETLDKRAGDIDLGDGIDADGITGKIGEISSKLEQLEIDSDRIARNISDSFAEIPDEIQITHDHNTPSGQTGDGDSTGNDPPVHIGSGFEKAAARYADGGTDGGGGGSFRDYIDRAERAGGHAPGSLRAFRVRDSDLTDLSKDFYHKVQGSDFPATNLDPPGEVGKGGVAVGADTDFGLEGASMSARRKKWLSDAEISDLASMPGSGGGSLFDSSSTQGLIRRSRTLSRIDGIRTTGDAMEALDDGLSGVNGTLKKLNPSMGKYMQLLAALIPIAVALGTQLLGVAAAMGAVGVAGASMLGLGLLGHGESMTGSVEQARQELQGLKRDLFEVFQPTAQQFAPIQSRMFDAIPDALGPVAEKMEGLRVFEDSAFEIGGILTQGLLDLLDVIIENEAAIEDLATSFSRLIVTGTVDFLEWLIKAASRNKALLISLGADIITLVKAAYNLSMAVSQVITAFSPWFNILLVITELLRSDLVITLIQLVGWLLALAKVTTVMYSLYRGFMVLAGGIKLAVGLMTAYTLSTWQAVAATAALIGLLTGGLALLGGLAGFGAMSSQIPTGGGGLSSGGVSSSVGGGSMVYNDNRSYQIEGGSSDYASEKAMEDTVERHNETQEARSLPDVRTSSNTTGNDN